MNAKDLTNPVARNEELPAPGPIRIGSTVTALAKIGSEFECITGTVTNVTSSTVWIERENGYLVHWAYISNILG